MLRDKIEFAWEHNRPALYIAAVGLALISILIGLDRCKGPNVLNSNQYNNEKTVGE